MRTRISLPSAIRTHVRPFSLIAPAFLLLTTPIIARAQAPNPVAYLTFDEGAGTVAHDSSGDKNAGSAVIAEIARNVKRQTSDASALRKVISNH